MNNNTQIETVEDKCRDVLNYLYPNNKTEMSCLQNKNSIDALKSIANWQKQQDEAKMLEQFDKGFAAGSNESTNRFNEQYKELLESHNELLERLSVTQSWLNESLKHPIANIFNEGTQKLINKAKNIKL